MSATETTGSTASRPVYHRRIFYVDQKIQAFMLGLLVVMEVALVAGALWVLYVNLSAILDAQLFRVHQPAVSDTTPILLDQLWRGVLGLVGVNVLALIIADRAWAFYTDTVARMFRDLMIRVIALDFAPLKKQKAWHRVLELAAHWRNREHERCRHINTTTQMVFAAVEAEDWKAAHAALGELRTRLSGAGDAT